MNLLRALKRINETLMAKRKKSPGKSARRGNMPSPYTKYGKIEYRYSNAYYDWKRSIIERKPLPAKDWKGNDVERGNTRQNKIAAE